jgi:hypothetical protein
MSNMLKYIGIPHLAHLKIPYNGKHKLCKLEIFHFGFVVNNRRNALIYVKTKSA